MRYLVEMLLSTVLLGTLVAWSAPDAPRQEEIVPKVVKVTFDGDVIDATLTAPDAPYIDARKRARHTNLIQVRESFREAILGSVASL